MKRRAAIVWCVAQPLSMLAPSGIASASSEEDGWAVLKRGGVVLFRHANVPGVGDPAGMKIGDCATQRNLDDVGRAQARRIGEVFRSRGIAVGKVLASQWCRSTQTAELAFPGQVTTEPAYNSFFGDRSSEPQQTDAARKILDGWSGPGALVVVTHQVNITALTGVAGLGRRDCVGAGRW